MFVLSTMLRIVILYIIIQSVLLGILFIAGFLYVKLTHKELSNMIALVTLILLIIVSMTLAILASMIMK